MPTCLNCHHPISGKYCVRCGQRASTRRFSIHTLWDGQFLDEVFQLNRGLGRTLVELLYRPGGLARDYIAGHRKRYFNFLTLLLLLVAADTILRSYSSFPVEEIMKYRFAISISDSSTEAMEQILSKSYRNVVILTVPFLALLQWLIFRRLRYNYWEHLVAVSFLVSAQALFSAVGGLIPVMKVSAETGKLIYQITAILIYALPLLFYWQLSKATYRSWPGRGWRVVLAWVLFISLQSGLLALVIGFYDGYNDPFGVN